MTTRYYKLEDESILKAFSEYYAKRDYLQNEGDSLGKEFGLGSAGFKQHGMWDLMLYGFECTYSERNKLVDKELWILPKDGYTRPKVKKGSVPYDKFMAAYRKLSIDASEIEDLIGFNYMDFFPCRPGYEYKGKKNLMIFLMPDKCDSVNGCSEITNIEFMELSNDKK